jgi:nitroimidazol reductase NimA-like FMN-containing flavoprotein (pyridoxamine 5'-phosphate oxidase superfamily)
MTPKGYFMRRADREITSKDELERILRQAAICRIGLLDGTLPYIVPLNFGYKDDCLYFHSAPEGRKITLLKKNPLVCFEVDIDHRIINTGEPCNWTSAYTSIIGYGTASLLTDPAQKTEALRIILNQYAPGAYTFPEENLRDVLIIKLLITEMTGKTSRQPSS